ncbi:MAG: DUF4249 domain-containing protein [Chlorobi bacterium]|nr:DUF4249 domain-containing protein [Chlorobiota bacterium]
MNLIKINKLQVLYFFGMFLIFSCTKEIEVKIPKEEQKLVVNSFFTPDKNIEVHVSQSAYIYDTVSLPVNNAIVKLYANNNFIDTLTFQSKGIYLSNIKPVTGKKYRLNVAADGYTDVTTFDKIPEKTKIISSSRIDNFGVNEYETAYSQLKVTFRDNPNEQNFYEIILIYYYDYNPYPYLSTDSTYASFARLNSNDPVIASEVEIDNGWWHQSLFFNDELFNGQKYTLSAIYRIILSPVIHEDYTLYVHLNSVSENYYNYKRKLYQYNQNSDGLWNNSGEAVQIFSNVENGYGIFAGYSSYIDTINQN